MATRAVTTSRGHWARWLPALPRIRSESAHVDQDIEAYDYQRRRIGDVVSDELADLLIVGIVEFVEQDCDRGNPAQDC